MIVLRAQWHERKGGERVRKWAAVITNLMLRCLKQKADLVVMWLDTIDAYGQHRQLLFGYFLPNEYSPVTYLSAHSPPPNSSVSSGLPPGKPVLLPQSENKGNHVSN